MMLAEKVVRLRTDNQELKQQLVQALERLVAALEQHHHDPPPCVKPNHPKCATLSQPTSSARPSTTMGASA